MLSWAAWLTVQILKIVAIIAEYATPDSLPSNNAKLLTVNVNKKAVPLRLSKIPDMPFKKLKFIINSF